MNNTMNKRVFSIIFDTAKSYILISLGIVLCVVGSVVIGLIPPLVLEKIVNGLTEGNPVEFKLIFSYILFVAVTGVFESARESLLTVFGQKITHAIRTDMSLKLSNLESDAFVKQEPGAVVSRLVNDVDTVESLFTSGIISMVADVFRTISIFAVIFVKSKGLAYVLLVALPLIYIFTRKVQKRMLKAQIDNRIAIAKVTNHVPETIKNIRTVHNLGKEGYMTEKYDRYIDESYRAVDRTNFYDSIYSPVILITNAVIVGLVYLFSASGNGEVLKLFGMNVGTSVALVAYITQIFGPIENIGMEIQTIQSAFAGVERIDDFFNQKERIQPAKTQFDYSMPAVKFENVDFAYEDGKNILTNLHFTINKGETLTLTGRTGAGKSTIFKLLTGLYEPNKGNVYIFGVKAGDIADGVRRKTFGYVEQNFKPVMGSVARQIKMSDESITDEEVVKAAQTVGLHDVIMSFENGYDTICTPNLFSQGQWQLLSIARAIAADPQILLLDEITANLDAKIEEEFLRTLQRASRNRTVISISHRMFRHIGGSVFNLDEYKALNE